ncbi:hypothetical protein [Bacillus sp. FJAT-29937]|uniref:hypothetical protein n=1 Tax=Bacillus sp. FJAT-29937 TaxID=1720553 RepID=UPI00082E03FB|nr:hypothetical protein [Bacillus sp. FJAT-29937]
MTNSLVVTLENDNFVQVQKIENGLPTGKRKLLTDDFLICMLGLMEDKELLSFLMTKDFIETIKTYMEDGEDDEIFNNIMQIVLDRVEKETELLENEPLYVELLIQLLEKVDIQKVKVGSMEKILESVFKKVEHLNDDVTIFQKLLLLLLEKGQVSSELKTPVISKILNVATKKALSTENQEELLLLLEAILEKADGKLVEKTLSKSNPDRVIYNGFMPKNIVYYAKTFSSEVVVIDVPKGRHNIKYHDVQYKDVGHPRLLFIFNVKEGRIRSIRIVAVKDKILSENTQLYRYPYSNVHDSGGVCWSYSQYHIDQLEKLQHIPYIFLSTPNNSHLSDNVRETYARFEKNDFDDEILRPMDLTFRQIV